MLIKLACLRATQFHLSSHKKINIIYNWKKKKKKKKCWKGKTDRHIQIYNIYILKKMDSLYRWFFFSTAQMYNAFANFYAYIFIYF